MSLRKSWENLFGVLGLALLAGTLAVLALA